MKRYLHLSVFALLTATVLAGCKTDAPDRHVYLNMTRPELRAKFGEPSRIVPTADGGEDWYYPMRTWSKAKLGGEATHDENTETGFAALTVSRSWNTEETPIHIAKDGYVTAPVPQGKVLKKQARE